MQLSSTLSKTMAVYVNHYTCSMGPHQSCYVTVDLNKKKTQARTGLKSFFIHVFYASAIKIVVHHIIIWDLKHYLCCALEHRCHHIEGCIIEVFDCTPSIGLKLRVKHLTASPKILSFLSVSHKVLFKTRFGLTEEPLVTMVFVN